MGKGCRAARQVSAKLASGTPGTTNNVQHAANLTVEDHGDSEEDGSDGSDDESLAPIKSECDHGSCEGEETTRGAPKSALDTEREALEGSPAFCHPETVMMSEHCERGKRSTSALA